MSDWGKFWLWCLQCECPVKISIGDIPVNIMREHLDACPATPRRA